MRNFAKLLIPELFATFTSANGTTMPPVQFITHNGKQVLLMDFSRVNSISEITRAADEIMKFVAMHRPKSLLAMVNLTGMRIAREKTKILRDMAAQNQVFYSRERV